MKAEELRIGNIVWDDYSGEMIVSAIDGDYVSLRKTLSLPEGTYKIELIQPILLTEEWLLKLWFTEGNQCYNEAFSIEILNTDFYLRPSYLGGFYWGFNINDNKMDCELNNVQPIKYVHQLQNLYFALTGEELKVKQ